VSESQTFLVAVGCTVLYNEKQDAGEQASMIINEWKRKRKQVKIGPKNNKRMKKTSDNSVKN